MWSWVILQDYIILHGLNIVSNYREGMTLQQSMQQLILWVQVKWCEHMLEICKRSCYEHWEGDAPKKWSGWNWTKCTGGYGPDTGHYIKPVTAISTSPMDTQTAGSSNQRNWCWEETPGSTHHSRYTITTEENVIRATANPILSRIVDDGMHGTITKFSIGSTTRIVTTFHNLSMFGNRVSCTLYTVLTRYASILYTWNNMKNKNKLCNY